jgi:putative effector of murein hydrolase LrgA (UPF0299 family)
MYIPLTIILTGNGRMLLATGAIIALILILITFVGTFVSGISLQFYHKYTHRKYN